jgi:tripartite-type tricarboxylate transporter receptor subunit TctC
MRHLIVAIAVIAAWGHGGDAAAQAPSQTYPSRPITMIVPFPVGAARPIHSRGSSPNSCGARSGNPSSSKTSPVRAAPSGSGGSPALPATVVDALASAPVRVRLAQLGTEIPPRDQQTPQVLAAYQKAEIEKWWPIIKAAGIKPE